MLQEAEDLLAPVQGEGEEGREPVAVGGRLPAHRERGLVPGVPRNE